MVGVARGHRRARQVPGEQVGRRLGVAGLRALRIGAVALVEQPFETVDRLGPPRLGRFVADAPVIAQDRQALRRSRRRERREGRVGSALGDRVHRRERDRPARAVRQARTGDADIGERIDRRRLDVQRLGEAFGRLGVDQSAEQRRKSLRAGDAGLQRMQHARRQRLGVDRSARRAQCQPRRGAGVVQAPGRRLEVVVPGLGGGEPRRDPRAQVGVEAAQRADRLGPAEPFDQRRQQFRGHARVVHRGMQQPRLELRPDERRTRSNLNQPIDDLERAGDVAGERKRRQFGDRGVDLRLCSPVHHPRPTGAPATPYGPNANPACRTPVRPRLRARGGSPIAHSATFRRI